MRTHDLPRGVHAIANVLTMILTDLPEGCLPDGEKSERATDLCNEALGSRCGGVRGFNVESAATGSERNRK